MVSALFSCSGGTPAGAGVAGSTVIASAGSAASGAPGSPTAGTGAGLAGASGSPTASFAGSSGTSTSSSAGEGNGSSGASAGSPDSKGGMAGVAGRGGTTGAGGKGGTGAGGKGGTTGTGGKSSTGGMSGGGQGGVVEPPPLTGGTPGWATRYWDCCKPACGWKGNVGGRTPIQSCTQDDQPLADVAAKNACESGGVAYMCHSLQPWAVSATLSYGYAAVSKGADYCGKCYQLQFTGGSHNSTVDAGSKALLGKTMIVQAINNGGVGSDQFDLLVPGGGVGLLNACSKQWGTADLGEQYGGFFLACQKANNFDYEKSKTCAKAKCDSVFANKPELRTGCEWFTGWFGAPDNPAVTYKEVTCPDAITNNSGLKR